MEVVQDAPADVTVYIYYDQALTEDIVFSITIFVETSSGNIELITQQFVLSTDFKLSDYSP
ncbi:MAG: hypothetical protein J5528_02085 [Firmicutes bacterium]|nr:hypothetical protein [Bacillota bacterium]